VAFHTDLYRPWLVGLDASNAFACQPGEKQRAGEELRLDVHSIQLTPLIGAFDMRAVEKLNLVLETREDLPVVARTDATEESEILRRDEAPAATRQRGHLRHAGLVRRADRDRKRAAGAAGQRRPTTRGQGR